MHPADAPLRRWARRAGCLSRSTTSMTLSPSSNLQNRATGLRWLARRRHGTARCSRWRNPPLACLALAALSQLAPTVAGQDSADRMERFQLFNACRPMELAIEDLPDDAAAIGLTKEALQTVAEKRLRAVRLDTEDRVEAGFAHLYVNVNVTSRGYHLSVEYMKSLTDTFGASGLAVTWESGSSGTQGGNAGFIVSRLSQHLDKFLAAYLGVNEPACGSVPGNASARRSGPSATSGMPRASAGAPRAGEAREFDLSKWTVLWEGGQRDAPGIGKSRWGPEVLIDNRETQRWGDRCLLRSAAAAAARYLAPIEKERLCLFHITCD